MSETERIADRTFEGAMMAQVKAKHIPRIRYQIAAEHRINKVMMVTHAGLGDQICAEPTLRHAFKLFPNHEISLLTSFPEAFDHLPFKKVYDKSDPKLSLDEHEWLIIHTSAKHDNLAKEFLNDNFIQAVDYASLCAFQKQLPTVERGIHLFGSTVREKYKVVIHPGRHWQSKTFPKHWWDEVIHSIKTELEEHGHDARIAIIGKDVSHEIGTVDVDTSGCTDLRNKLSLKQLITVLKQASVVVTNDSAPLHIASAGKAHVLFVASCKSPDHLTHWREGGFGWRMANMEKDGLWNHQTMNPIRDTDLKIDVMSEDLMEKLLPNPSAVAEKVYRRFIQMEYTP